jgi:hypothetical protein
MRILLALIVVSTSSFRISGDEPSIVVDGHTVPPNKPLGESVAIIDEGDSVRVVSIGSYEFETEVAVAVDERGRSFDLHRGVIVTYDPDKSGYVLHSTAVLDDGTMVDLDAREVHIGAGTVVISGDRITRDGVVVGSRSDVLSALGSIGFDSGSGFRFVGSALYLRSTAGMTVYVSPTPDSGFILYSR